MELLKEAGAVDGDMVENTIDSGGAAGTEKSIIDDFQDEAKIEVVDSTLLDHEKVSDPSPDLIADTGRIMVRNLPYSCTYEDLEVQFKKFGPIAEV
jgi:hypothetical protein